MDDIIDLLQIKIEKAKSNLSDDTLNAIASVPWKDIIIGMREKKGYTFEQLGDLELETELLLCGLVSPENYPKELRSRLKISEGQVNELVKEMNELIFSKIKEELIKSTERKKMFAKKNSPLEEYSAPRAKGGGRPLPNLPLTKGEERRGSVAPQEGNKLPVPEKLELDSPLEEYPKGEVDEFYPPRPDGHRGTPQEGNIHPILAQKMSGPVQTPIVKTEHTLENITRTAPPTPPPTIKTGMPKVDPYRELPE